MTQEDKELLLKDLCARLPYGVVIQTTGVGGYTTQGELRCIDNISNNFFIYHNNIGFGYDINRDIIKPHLFPLSSMTEEQKKEYDSIIYYNVELHCERYYNVIDVDYYEELHDFYHKNHIDYRGLIPMGLAIDATGLNIYKNG